jgi:hypothetical protein
MNIQYQDESGNWVTGLVSSQDPGNIRSTMLDLQRQRPNVRIRAVDFDGKLVDIL